LLQSGVHLFFFDELAPMGVGFAFDHGGVETRILVQQPQSGVLQQFARVGLTVAAGILRQLRFLLLCEMDFRVINPFFSA
jgi:hypothetical protein